MPHSFGKHFFHDYQIRDAKLHLFSDTDKPSKEEGIFGWNTSSNEFQIHNGSSFVGFVDKASAQTITGHKTLGEITLNGAIDGSHFANSDLYAVSNAATKAASVSAILQAINDSTLDTEQIQDAAAAMIENGNHSQINIEYDDPNNQLNFSVPDNHPSISNAESDTAYSGAQVVQNMKFDEYGHVTSVTSQTITPSLIGAQPAGSYDNYTRWVVSDGTDTGDVESGDQLEFKGGTNVSTSYSSGVLTINASHYSVSPGSISALSGATVISNVEVDSNGHVTDFSTRDITPGDIGAEPAHNHPYLPLSGGTLTGDLHIGEDGSPKDLHIWGNIIQEAGAYEVHAEQIYTSQETVILREDSSTAIGSGAVSGIKVTAYDGTNDLIFGTGNDGWFRIGEPDSEQLIATRDDNANISDGNLLKLDESTNMLVDAGIAPSDIILDADMSNVAYVNVDNNFTVDQSVSGDTIYHEGNLTTSVINALNVDADKLDGEHGSYYLNYNNFTNTPDLSDLHSPVSLDSNDTGILSLSGQSLTFNGTNIARRNTTNTFSSNQTFNSDILFGGSGTHSIIHDGGTASSDKIIFEFSDGQNALEIDGSGKVKANSHFDSGSYKLSGNSLYLDHLTSLGGSASTPKLPVSDGSSISWKSVSELSNNGLSYTKTITQSNEDSSFSIPETEHGCGTEPSVQCYVELGTGERVHAGPETIEVDSNGDITITFGENIYGYIKVFR